MANPATKDDVQRAVKDALGDVRNDVSRIKDAVQRVDQRTEDLDRSQDEIKRLVQLEPHIVALSRMMEEVHDDADKIDRVVIEIANLKSQLATTTQYLQQVAGYLKALDERSRSQDDDEGYKRT
jgi:ABC-type transporter Mla subunit MlaD